MQRIAATSVMRLSGGGGGSGRAAFRNHTNRLGPNAMTPPSVFQATTAAVATRTPGLLYYSSVNATAVAERVERLLAAKTEAGLSYDDLALSLGVTNTYAAQLLMGQAKLTAHTAPKLRETLPGISEADLTAMQTEFPMRTFDEEILKEPNVYRTYEALMHNGEAIKAIINEQCGDGIMSAIDFYCDVGTTSGLVHGETRVVITLNGKFLPYAEQLSEHNGAKSPRQEHE